MNKNSIIFTITITFIIALVLVLVSFSILYNVSEKREELFMAKRGMQASNLFMRDFKHHGLTQELEEDLKLINYSIITDPLQQRKILKNSNIKYGKSHIRGRGRTKIQLLSLNDKYYVYIQNRRGNVILENDNQEEHHGGTILIIFTVIFFTFIFLYITTLKKLKPLKLLQQKVQNFGDEEFDIEFATSNKDEISLLANEFDKSAKKLKSIKESRNVFIRNIMHELKTPITKGKFLAELPQTEENSEKMKKVFYRLESMINEFASIEALLSSKNKLETKEYYLEDIIDNSMDILMCDENQVVKEYEDIKLEVDFKLFCIAIKNLLDNGIKYSENNLVTVQVKNQKIIFNNIGKSLQYPLESYFEPFFKGNDSKSNQSFGLGVYIVKHILEAHDYSLEYIYENSINKFIIYKNK